MTTPIICRPPSFPIRRILNCPTCKQKRRMAGRDHGPYYGPTVTCCGCGDSWSCGELLQRPFKRAWRTEAIDKAKRAWNEAGQYTPAEYGEWLVAELATAMADHGGSVEDVPLSAEEPGPVVRVFHRADGWVLPDYTDLAECTTNFHREQDGRPACTATAVWKVVEDHGLHLTFGFYCDADLPAQHRPQAA